MEIRPVSLAQLAVGRDGRQYEVSGEAGWVARELQEIDPSLKCLYNEYGNYFVVVQTIPDGPRAGEEEIVMRVQPEDWNRKVVEDFRLRNFELRHGISPCDRLEAAEDALKADADYRYEQRIGEVAQRLFVSLQREVVGVNPRAFIRRGIPKAA